MLSEMQWSGKAASVDRASNLTLLFTHTLSLLIVYNYIRHAKQQKVYINYK